MKGSYIIAIYLAESITIRIGSLGEIDFLEGYYLYIGSAMGKLGSTTLENRVKRHISNPKNKKIFWHIDYLLTNRNCIINYIYLIPSLNRIECILSKELYEATDKYIKNFGSSDCQCPSHLYYFTEFNGIESCFN